jgi:hypothetical protein
VGCLHGRSLRLVTAVGDSEVASNKQVGQAVASEPTEGGCVKGTLPSSALARAGDPIRHSAPVPTAGKSIGNLHLAV